MLVSSLWLASLLGLVSTTAHAYNPAHLGPRYLSIGTAISLPATSAPPYPTGSANETVVPTGTTYSTPSTSTVAPTHTPSLFYLVAAGTGTFIDGYHLVRSCCVDTPGALILTDYLIFQPAGGSRDSEFSLYENGTIQVALTGVDNLGRSGNLGHDYDLWYFFSEPTEVTYEHFDSFCKIVNGELKCVTGENTVFHTCLEYEPDGSWNAEGTRVYTGPPPPGLDNCFLLTVLVVVDRYSV